MLSSVMRYSYRYSSCVSIPLPFCVSLCTKSTPSHTLTAAALPSRTLSDLSSLPLPRLGGLSGTSSSAHAKLKIV